MRRVKGAIMGHLARWQRLGVPRGVDLATQPLPRSLANYDTNDMLWP